jgi:hypothetical protein
MPFDMPDSLTPTRLLKLWHKALIKGVRRDTPDLSARQMAVLLNIYVDPQPHTMRALSNN